MAASETSSIETSIELYKSQIEKKEAEPTEIWFAKYRLACSYEEKGDWDKALYWYLEAFQTNPNRADPLQKIATYYRIHKENDLAYLFANHGLRLPYPEKDAKFSDYQLDEELSIASYYTNFKADGYAAADRLILKKNVPWQLKSQTYRNISYYASKLAARYQPIEIELPLIHSGSVERYYPMNPSIMKTDSGFLVICRSVNYAQRGAKFFSTSDPQGIFRTRNFLLSYDQNFHLLSKQEIIEDLPREKYRSCNVEGLEDCRLFQLDNSICFTCTTSDTNGVSGDRQISACKLARELGDTIHVEKLVPLKGPTPFRCEKNWLPFVKDGQLYLLYSYDPLTLFTPDLTTGDCKKILSQEHLYDFSNFRGSAAPIEFEDGYLLLVHEVVHLPDETRYYLHRFVFLDRNFIAQKLSKPFIFKHLGIEFCLNMTFNHAETELILAVGIEDREAYLCFMNKTDLHSLLEPLPDYN